MHGGVLQVGLQLEGEQGERQLRGPVHGGCRVAGHDLHLVDERGEGGEGGVGRELEVRRGQVGVGGVQQAQEGEGRDGRLAPQVRRQLLHHDALHAGHVPGPALGLRDVGEVEAVGDHERRAGEVVGARVLTREVERADGDARQVLRLRLRRIERLLLRWKEAARSLHAWVASINSDKRK